MDLLCQAGQRTFIWESIEASPFVYFQSCSILSCLNSEQAYLSDRSDQISLDKSILHSLMVQHNCGINLNLLFNPFNI